MFNKNFRRYYSKLKQMLIKTVYKFDFLYKHISKLEKLSRNKMSEENVLKKGQNK